jgi:hypothetical protein
MKAQLRSRNGVIAASAAGVLLIVAAIWFFGVSAQNSQATKLDSDITTTQAKITQRLAELASPSAQVHVRASDLYRLTKAMPDQTDMAGIILALNRLAASHKVQFEGIQTVAPVSQAGFNVQPVTVTLQGRFSAVSAYLRDLRRLVDVHRKALVATGRLFSVDQITLGQPDNQKSFPDLKATITLDAFMFAGGTPAAPSTTTPSAPSGTVAAGATQ